MNIQSRSSAGRPLAAACAAACAMAGLAAHPLRVGLSMHVTVDVRARGAPDPMEPSQRPLA